MKIRLVVGFITDSSLNVRAPSYGWGNCYGQVVKMVAPQSWVPVVVTLI